MTYLDDLELVRDIMLVWDIPYPEEDGINDEDQLSLITIYTLVSGRLTEHLDQLEYLYMYHIHLDARPIDMISFDTGDLQELEEAVLLRFPGYFPGPDDQHIL